MPDTMAYMLLGYGITVVILIGMVAYLIFKFRTLRAELKLLQTLEKEGKSLDETPPSTARDNSPQHGSV